MRHPVRALIVGALVVGLAATGCDKNTGSTGTGNEPEKAQSAIIVDYKGETQTPAAPVEGATPGGKLTIMQEGDFEHLSPQQIYVSNALSYSLLFHRQLTGYIEDAKGGPLKLVGDLATNAGETTDEGKTWKYTLRDGVKFEDGTPITSKDVAYGIAISFSTYGVQGPQYLQSALDPQRAYKGPFDSKGAEIPGVTTPDDKTIVFTFDRPHAELPYLVSYPTATPIQESKFNKEKYETSFQSTGPYKIKEYKRDAFLDLEKNPNWDPKSDPIRNQYVDTVHFEFTVDGESETNRLIASQGDDAAAIMTGNVVPQKIAEVKADPEIMKRTLSAATPFVRYLYINTQRVTDVSVRQALNYAFDRDAYIKAIGGYDVAEPASTTLAPVVPGYKKFDEYPGANGGSNGDVEKAKSLLAGKTVPKLKFCFGNTPVNQTVMAVVQTGLARAGFTFSSAPIDPAAFYTTVGDKTTDCDLISGGWAQDFPDGDATLGVLFDGTKIVDKGNNNLGYFNDPAITAKIGELRTLADRSAAANQYGDLDQQIMKAAPVIPLRYDRFFAIHGSKVGGTFASPLWAHFNITGIYVKS